MAAGCGDRCDRAGCRAGPPPDPAVSSTVSCGARATIRWRWSGSVVDHVGADSGDDLLPALVESLQRELRFDTVAIDVRRDRRMAIGSRRSAHRAVPSTTSSLEQQGDVVGRLVVGWGGRIPVRQRDEQVLAELAGPLALAVGWVRLAADLRRSSVDIVSAREEERRRLRRDLHDGLGPSLTGVSLGVAHGDAPARTLSGEVSCSRRRGSSSGASPTRSTSLVVELKRIVRDLRPTALDQLGLVDAVAEFTRTFSDDLEIASRFLDDPVELPAAVEVAAYRIVTEAVTNVVRHARADAVLADDHDR